jgi:hypothetical protein
LRRRPGSDLDVDGSPRLGLSCWSRRGGCIFRLKTKDRNRRQLSGMKIYGMNLDGRAPSVNQARPEADRASGGGGGFGRKR